MAENVSENVVVGTSRVYITKPGDYLAQIAARFYADSKRWRDIAEANGIRDPRYIRAGIRLKLPE